MPFCKNTSLLLQRSNFRISFDSFHNFRGMTFQSSGNLPIFCRSTILEQNDCLFFNLHLHQCKTKSDNTQFDWSYETFKNQQHSTCHWKFLWSLTNVPKSQNQQMRYCHPSNHISGLYVSCSYKTLNMSAKLVLRYYCFKCCIP